MDLSNLKAINEKVQADQLAMQRHSETQMSVLQLQETVVKSFQSLTDYLDHKVTRTEVLNQPEEIGTPDVEHVVDAIHVLSEMMIRNKLDISPIQDSLSELLSGINGVKDGISGLPTEFPEIEIPEQKDEIKVTNLDDIDFTTLENAIKGIKMVAEAPQVNVDAPDLSPIKDSLSNVIKAVKAIKFPEIPKTDLTKVEKKLDTSNKILKDILEKPVGGGGGGGSSWVATDQNGIPVPIELTVDGKIPVEAGATSNYESRNDTISDTNLVYLGKALPGTAISDAGWQIKRYNKSAGHMSFADDVTTYTKQWSQRTSYSY